MWQVWAEPGTAPPSEGRSHLSTRTEVVRGQKQEHAAAACPPVRATSPLLLSDMFRAPAESFGADAMATAPQTYVDAIRMGLSASTAASSQTQISFSLVR